MVALVTDLTGTGSAPAQAALLGESIVTGIAAGVGGTVGAAIAITGTLNLVATVASVNDSLILPVIASWQNSQMIVIQNRAANAAKVFPGTANSINGGTVTTGTVSIAGVSTRVFYRVSNTDWASWVTLQ